MWELPTSTTVNGKQFHIRNKGDYRLVLDCFNALNDEDLSEDYRVLASLLIFYNELDYNCIGEYTYELEELVKYMYKFFECGKDSSIGANTDRPVLDWDKDAQMICAAINNVAKQEIRSLDYLHWWTFMGYYLSVGESMMSTVVSIRHKLLHGKKLEKWERDFKKENPEYFVWKTSTVSDREAEDLIRDLWNQGGEN